MFEGFKKRRRLKNAEMDYQIKEMEAAQAALGSVLEATKKVPVIDPDEGQWFKTGEISSSGEERGIETYDHEKMLSQAWKFWMGNLFARAIVRNLVKFVLGKGPILRPEDNNERVLEVWNEFCYYNKWSLKEKEMATRTFRDGEVFMRFFVEPEGKLSVRFLRASKIKNPTDSRLFLPGENVSHGIGTDLNDVEKPITYYHVSNNMGKEKVIRIPAEEVLHIKILSDSDMKRGVSFLLIAMPMIKKYDSWLEDRIILNKIRSAIALIRKVEGTSSTVESIRNAYKSQYQSGDKNRQQTPHPGTIITAGKGISYDMLSPNINAQDVKDDGRAMLLAIAAGSGFPEMFLTADYCHDSETEVLTDHGFMSPYDARSKGYKLGTVNPKIGHLEYHSPIEWNFTGYKGKLHLFEGNRLNFAVTPNHEMWMRKENSHRLPEFRKDSSLDDFEKIKMKEWNEGVCSVRDFVTPTFRKKEDRNSIEKIESLLGLSTGTIRDWKSYNLTQKRFPDFIWELSANLKELLLTTLIDGDGSIMREETNYRRFYSFSSALVDDVQRLAFELGYHATSRMPHDNEGGYVDISSGHNCMLARKNIVEIDYDGPIWCAIVPNGLLVTRRKGRIFISGNSNANYASTMVAQNPFVREIEDWQDFFAVYYKEIFARVIKAGIEYGDLPKGTKTNCTMEWPSLITADIEKNNKAREIQHRNKILSKKTWQQKEGLDPNVEEINMQEEEGKDIYKQPFNLPIVPTNQYQSEEK